MSTSDFTTTILVVQTPAAVFHPFDIGTIAQSWKHQPGSSIYSRDINLSALKKRVDIMGTAWSDMRNVIIVKRKADEALMKADYPVYLKGLQE